MGAGEPQMLAQQLHQQGAGVDVGGDGFAIHRQGNGCHGVPPQEYRSNVSIRRAVHIAGRFEGRNLDDFARFRSLKQ
jgi:hypothetical protein